MQGPNPTTWGRTGRSRGTGQAISEAVTQQCPKKQKKNGEAGVKRWGKDIYAKGKGVEGKGIGEDEVSMEGKV